MIAATALPLRVILITAPLLRQQPSEQVVGIIIMIVATGRTNTTTTAAVPARAR